MTDLSTWHTWREIHAQPGIWASFGPQVLAQRDELRAWMLDSGATEIWFSGAGTSAYIGDFVSATFDAEGCIPMRSIASTDLVSAPHQFLGSAKPVVVNFGRSGNCAETIGVLNLLDQLAPDAPRLNITCNADSVLATRPAKNRRVIVLPDATHNVGIAMTSSYTTMLLTALTIFDPAPALPQHVFAALATALEDALPGYRAMAEAMEIPKRMIVTGSGALRYTAREAAMKIMELTAGEVPVMWDSALGLRHGPKAFVVPGTHVLCLISSDPEIARYDHDLAVELRSQFTDITVTEIAPTDLPDTWGSLVQVAAAQVIAAVLSARMGLDVDDPFAAKGTLPRVVSDVTLYPPTAL